MAIIPHAHAWGVLARSKNELTKNECSARHMDFSSRLFPAASWISIMRNLSDHFGEDASLPTNDTKTIEAYLVDNAGRIRNVDPNNPPQRITELRWFTHEHGSRTRSRAENNSNIMTMSNCTACHRDAEKGYFDDD